MRFDPPLTSSEVEAAFNGTFTALREIHKGGQAAVFRAADAQGHDVALKIYYPGAKHVLERSDREIEALQQFRVPSIVRLHASGDVALRNASCPFVATDFISGDVLRARIRRGPLPVRDVVQVGLDVSAAIAELWGKRRVHRDLSPNNIMWELTGRAVVIDLGLVRHTETPAVTTAGMAWGTPRLSVTGVSGGATTAHVQIGPVHAGRRTRAVLNWSASEPARSSEPHRATRDVASFLIGVPADFAMLLQRMLDLEPARGPMPQDVIARLRLLPLQNTAATP